MRKSLKICQFLSQAKAETLIHEFIACRIDYCNSLLSGLPKTSICQLHLVENSSARLLTKTRKRAHITPIFKSLLWLPVSFRIDLKDLLLVSECLTDLAPSYLLDSLLSYVTMKAFGSAGRVFWIFVPKSKTKTQGATVAHTTCLKGYTELNIMIIIES